MLVKIDAQSVPRSHGHRR